jgi:hypothetical protein
MTKLDLGAGPVSPEGFTALGHDQGSEIFPLPYEPNSVDEIRASHVLEHFPHGQTIQVLLNWVSKLKPGGRLSIAVPNFNWIAEHYVAGHELNTAGFTMGGQSDDYDYHKALFDEELLAESLRLAGLIDIETWTSELQDCAALPVSLNLCGTKPRKRSERGADQLTVAAVMSVPRLGFMDNFFCAFEALSPMGIPLSRYEGAFWDACLERTITKTLDDHAPELILTIDYDTVFKRSDVEQLIQIMQERPEVDALAPMQSARGDGRPLLTLDLPLGVEKHDRIPHGVFADDVTKLKTAHFGLTLIRASALAKMKKPWFWGQPNDAGDWGEGRTDADIYFWKQFEKDGLGLYSANRVVVGHLELMIRWPGQNLDAQFQMPGEWRDNGKPEGAWK